VQKFATKLGALNLAKQIEQEEDASLQEAYFQALSTLIKADHFDGKRAFI